MSARRSRPGPNVGPWLLMAFVVIALLAWGLLLLLGAIPR